MRKMPTLFKRVFDEDTHKIKEVLPEVTPGCEWVMNGEGIATEKVDGSCCAVICGTLYRRYDAKGRRRIPMGAIPCQEMPDPVTGHFPHWVKVEPRWAGDKWYVAAYINTPWINEPGDGIADGTYEAVGPHFQANPYGLDEDVLERHGRIKIDDCPRDFEGIKEYLRTHEIEGIVWHRGNGDMCKIKRRDFGFEWPVRRGDEE